MQLLPSLRLSVEILQNHFQQPERVQAVRSRTFQSHVSTSAYAFFAFIAFIALGAAAAAFAAFFMLIGVGERLYFKDAIITQDKLP